LDRNFLYLVFGWNSGTLQASSKDNKLLLKGAAPGTFFAVCGAIIVGVALFKGYALYYAAGVRSLAQVHQHYPHPREVYVRHYRLFSSSVAALMMTAIVTYGTS
jgi:hypothetical protein